MMDEEQEIKIVVEYLIEEDFINLAKSRGFTGEDNRSLYEFCEPWEASKERIFPTVELAKAWAIKNKDKDMCEEPKVREYEITEYGEDLIGSWVLCGNVFEDIFDDRGSGI